MYTQNAAACARPGSPPPKGAEDQLTGFAGAIEEGSSGPKMAQQLESAARQVERQAGPEGAAAAAKIRSMAGEKLSAADKQSIMEAERQRLINRDKAQRERNRGRDLGD